MDPRPIRAPTRRMGCGRRKLSMAGLMPDPMHATMDLIVARPEGLYCPPGDFYIDPWRPVDRAVITHAPCRPRAHRARPLPGARAPARASCAPGSGDIDLQTLAYGEPIEHHGVRCRCIRPGMCSARRRCGSNTAAKCGWPRATTSSRTTAPARRSSRCRCDTFITESTFGLPIYRWPPQAELFADINDWWRAQRGGRAGQRAVLLCVRQGAAHPARPRSVDRPDPRARRGRAAERGLPRRRRGAAADAARDERASTPADAASARWCWRRRRRRARRGCGASATMRTRFASGWMQLRGTRRRRGVDRGFVLSDHADWPGLAAARSASTGAERVFVTHGSVAVMVRWLQRARARGAGLRDRIRRRRRCRRGAPAPSDAPRAAA